MTMTLLEMGLPMGETLKTSGVGFILVLIILAVIAVLIKLISKGFEKVTGGRKKEEAEPEEKPQSKKPAVSVPVAAPVVEACPGTLVLDGVSEPTAAVIMALVSHQTGIPLNRLAFSSIKCISEKLVLEGVEDNEAAVIMALISHKTGIPLERLDFVSIRQIKEN